MNKINKEKMMTCVKFYGYWLIYYVILGSISSGISFYATQNHKWFNTYIIGSMIIVPILMTVPVLIYFGKGIVALVKMLIDHLKKKDTSKAKKIAKDSFIFLAVCFLMSGMYHKVFPDYSLKNANKFNLENNILKAENNLTKEEVTQIIEEIEKDNNVLPILRIKDIDCVGVKNKAENCQSGDIEVKIGKSFNCGPLCGHGSEKYYLMRKIENKWRVIKTFGESNWIS